MIRENQQLLNQFNVLTDAVAVLCAMLVSYWLRFVLFTGVRGMPFNYYVWLGVVAAALTLVTFAVAGMYESFRAVRFHVEAGRVAVLDLLVSLVVMAAMYVLRLGETSRWTVAFFYAVSTVLLIGKRACMRLLLRHYRAMGYNLKRVLLVGHGESAETYLRKVTDDRNLGYQVIGYVADCRGWDALPTAAATISWTRCSSVRSRTRWCWRCPRRRGSGSARSSTPAKRTARSCPWYPPM